MTAKIFTGFDIIGDVHGCAFTLIKLLEKLDYREVNGVYSHPRRQAIFVGDLIDRGPHIREVVLLVKAMVDAGQAECLMGNHEYNALGYYLWLPSHNRHLREHTPRHKRLLGETLNQFAAYPDEWKLCLAWMQERPLFLEGPGFRVVHACWDSALIDQYKRCGKNTVDADFMRASVDESSFAGLFMDRLTRGTDMPLPGGHVVLGRDGYSRSRFRTKFWCEEARTYEDVVFQPDPLPPHLLQTPLNRAEKARLLTYDLTEPPVFVGHYWLQGRPQVLRPNIACLDYSAVKYGRLVAYRFDGEHTLSNDKFVWVYVDPVNDN